MRDSPKSVHGSGDGEKSDIELFRSSSSTAPNGGRGKSTIRAGAATRDSKLEVPAKQDYERDERRPQALAVLFDVLPHRSRPARAVQAQRRRGHQGIGLVNGEGSRGRTVRGVFQREKLRLGKQTRPISIPSSLTHA